MTDPILDGILAKRGQAHAAAVLTVGDTTPDTAASDQALARRAGLPVGVVRSDPAPVRRQVARDELANVANPAMSGWLSHPDNYAVASDDVGMLDRLSSLFDKPRAFVAGATRTIGSTIKGAGDIEQALSRRTLGLFGLDESELAYLHAFNPIDVVAARGARPAGAAVKRTADTIDVPEERQGFGTAVAGGLGQLGVQVVQGIVAAPTLAPSLLSQGADQMQERVAASGKDGTAGGDAAILGGAAVTGITERYGIGKLLERVPPSIRNAVLRKIADTLTAGGIEAAQETAENIGQDILEKVLFNPDRKVGDGVLQQAEAAGGTGAVARLLLQALGVRRAHLQAQDERRVLNEQVEAASQSNTRRRAPERFADAVETAAPGRKVYVPREALEAHFANRADPVTAINDLAGHPNAYAESQLTGADVEIPLSRYLAQIGTDAHASLSGQIRTTAGEDVRPDSIMPTREQVEADIAAGLEEARNAPETPDTLHPVYRPLLTDPTQADDWAGYQAAVQRARYAEKAERLAELNRVADIARDKVLRKQTQATVETELRGHPVYKAERLLRLGKDAKGEAVGQAVKLDHAAVVEAIGEERAGKLKGMTRKRGGVSPDEAASLLGYSSGAKLLHDLATAPAFADMVRVETDARMQEHTKPREAEVGDAQTEVLLREVQAVEARNGGVRTHDAALREIARRLIEDKGAQDVQPHVYRNAEAKAAREAYAAASKGDWTAAAQARRRQLQNLYLYREARNARDEVTAFGKRGAQLSKRASLAKLGKAGGDFQEQVLGLLGRFDFRPLTGPQIDERTSLAKWLKQKQAEGVTIDIPPSIADEAFRTPFRKMKVGEIRDLRDAVEQIVHAANEANTLRANGERFDRMLVDHAMAQSVEDGGTIRPEKTGDPTFTDKAREELWRGRALMGGATDLARELDGFKDGGAVWNHTVGIIRDANDRTLAELDKAREGLAEIKLRHYSKDELRALSKRQHFPGIGDWSKGRVLALALNWGNAGNREAILTQVDNRLSPEQVGELFRSLDKRDWTFVQDVWTLIDGYWPAIAEAQRRRRGIVPAKVQPTPFGVVAKDGETIELPGGYYPLKFGGTGVQALAQESADMYDDIRLGRFANAATRDGHTIERVGSAGKEVRLDLGVIDGHLRNVVRDLYLGDAVNMVHRTLHGQQFVRAADQVGKSQVVKGMELWLRDVASGEVGLRSIDEKAVRFVRTNFTAAVLTWRAASAALQVTGVFQSAVVLDSPGAMLDGIGRFLRRPVAMTRYATNASPLMKRRLQSHVEAVQQVWNAEAGRFSQARAEMFRRGFWMMGRVQSTVDVATWIAAEKQGLAKFDGDVRKARKYADDVVERAQGSNDWIAKNAIQRGTLSDNVRQSEWIRATTALQGYLIAKFNVGTEQVRKADVRSVRGASKLAGNVLLLYVVESMVGRLVRGQLPEDEDKDGSRVDDFLRAAGGDFLGSAFGAVPGAGQLLTEMRGYTDRGQIGELWHTVAETITQVKQGEADRAARRAAVKLSGLLTGAPSTQINKSLDAIDAAAQGREVTPWEYLDGPERKKE